MENEVVLEIRNLDKQYPGVHALQNFSLALRKGEIHCLLGQNGAGKSTLVKMLSGSVLPDSGDIFLNGAKLVFKDPIDAQNKGIFTIHQELSLIPELSVAENIFIDSLPKNKFGIIDWKQMESEADRILKWLGFSINVKTPVKRLSMAQRSSIELAKSLHHEAKVILLDEPTASLPAPDVSKFFDVIRNLSSQGITFIFISHRLEEVLALCEKATVLRDGKQIGTYDLKGQSEKFLVKAMIGQDLQESSIIGNVMEGNVVQLGHGGNDKVVLSARNLSNGQFVHDISFDLHEGEILGITGLVGSGQNELALMLFDGSTLESGSISIMGEDIKRHSPKYSIERSLGLLPEERKSQGLVLPMSILHNSSLASLKQLSKASFINRFKERNAVAEYTKKVHLKGFDSVNQPVNSLSGGNQQKIVLSKWLLSGCKILIFSEPTRGIDVGAKEEIYQLIKAYVESGGSVILITSEITEGIMCDRVLIMNNGTIKGEIQHKDIKTADSILNLF